MSAAHAAAEDTSAGDRGTVRRRPWSVAWSAVVAVVAAVPVVAVLLPAQLVVMDGGLHLSSSVALRSTVTGRWPELLSWRPGLPPNLTVELLMAALSGLVDPDVAVRAVVVLALVGFAVAAVVLVRAAGAPPWTALLVLPMQMNAMVMVGLLGFLVAVTPALLAVALVLRRPGRFSVAAVTALLVLTWLTHLVPALAGLVGVVAVVVAHELPGAPGGAVRALRRLAAPVVVVLGLTVLFLLAGGTDGSRGASPFGGGLDVLELRTPLIALAQPEYLLARVLSVALYGAAVVLVLQRWRRGALRPVAADGLLVAAVVLGVAAAVAPDRIGSTSYVAGRLSIFLPIFLGAWVATGWTTTPDRWARRAVAAAAALATVVALAVPLARVPAMASFGQDLAELRGLAPCVPSGATIAQLSVDGGHDRAVRLTPTVDLAGYLAVERGLLDLRNVSGSVSYYTWSLAPGARPVPALAPVDEALDDVPPRITLGAAVERGYPLQTVVVYGRRDAAPDVLDDPGWRGTEADLVRDFRRVRTTPTGLAELWVRKDVVSPCG
ncbi:hypothetical protein ACR9E3_27530 [Actinomycetospora sp. C-140]